MPKQYHIFVPEYVPLKNKGEEAIIRGMGDIIFPNEEVEFHILDMHAREPYSVEGIHVYPGTWFYSPWRSQPLVFGTSPTQIRSSACAVSREILNHIASWWVKIPQRPVRKTAKLLRRFRAGRGTLADVKAGALRKIMNFDFLIAGHDGVFNEYDCHVIDMMRHGGMSYGIFGTQLRTGTKNKNTLAVYAKTLSQAEFIYCRDRISTDWARSHFPGLDIELAPDPAFGMRPAPEERVNEMIGRERLGSFFAKPVVMVTPAETTPIARHCFKDVLSRESKLAKHRSLLASLVRHIVQNCDANVLFLPHTTGPTADLDDRRVAVGILRELQEGEQKTRLFETAGHSARDLKGLIGKAELLVGERIHSIIAAVGVHTPFMSLGVHQDNRVQGILGEMCGCSDLIYYLNSPDEVEIRRRFDHIWARRERIKNRLQTVSDTLEARLREVGKVIRGKIR